MLSLVPLALYLLAAWLLVRDVRRGPSANPSRLGVPFWVACPTPTIDPRAARGEAIPIEARDARELTHVSGLADDGRVREVRVVPEGVPGFNPAFDVTPARLVDALVTEHGVFPASARGVGDALRGAGRDGTTD